MTLALNDFALRRPASIDILNKLSLHGVDIQFRRGGTLLTAQRVLVVNTTSASRVPVEESDKGIGAIASKDYTLIAAADLDVQVGDRFVFRDPAGHLNFRVEHVNRAYTTISGHVEVYLQDME